MEAGCGGGGGPQACATKTCGGRAGGPFITALATSAAVGTAAAGHPAGAAAGAGAGAAAALASRGGPLKTGGHGQGFGQPGGGGFRGRSADAAAKAAAGGGAAGGLLTGRAPVKPAGCTAAA